MCELKRLSPSPENDHPLLSLGPGPFDVCVFEARRRSREVRGTRHGIEAVISTKP